MADQQRYIAMTGATGFVGKKLRSQFRLAGWNVLPLSRSDFKGSAEQLAKKISKAEVVINLAGAPIIGRWTETYKRTLYDSRVALTVKLAEAIALLESKPALFISTSAIGIYDAQGHHTEDDCVMADNFLGRLAADWEKAALTVENLGVRTVIFRLGVVLGKNGGALQKMLRPFRMGLGGILGSGTQHFSWVHLADVVAVYEAVVADSSYRGIYNLTAPEPTTNRGLTKALGTALSRPTLLPVPAFVLSLLLGEGAQVLTSGQCAYPKRLLEAGFRFTFSQLSDALQECLG